MERTGFDRYVRLSKVNKIPGFPLKASTLYAWRVQRKYPQMFAVLGGSVFVDLDEMERILEGRGDSYGESSRP